MSLVECQSTERSRQVAQWREARARIDAAAIVKPVLIKVVEKPVEKLAVALVAVLAAPIAPSIPMFAAPGERDWLDVSTRYAMTDILREVCVRFGISKSEILSSRRFPALANARQVVMTIAKHLTRRSLPEIGRFMGGRDHTTVIHACRKYAPVLAVVITKIPDHSPISVWVEAFKKEIEITGHAERKRYARRATV